MSPWIIKERVKISEYTRQQEIYKSVSQDKTAS